MNSAVIGAIEKEPGIDLLNLLERTRGVAEPDEIYMLIASGAIYVDLNVAPIAEPERVRVFATAEIAAAFEVVSREASVEIGVRSIDGRLCESPDLHSEAFLLLKAQAEGLAPALIPLVLVWMNLVYAITATPAGIPQ